MATEVLPWLEREAKQRKVKAGKETGRGNKKVSEKLHEPLERSDTQAGQLLGVSGRYVAEAKSIKEKAPELFEQVKSGFVLQGCLDPRRESKSLELAAVRSCNEA